MAVLLEDEHAALSCDIGVGDHADAARKDLDEDGKDASEKDDEEERVAKLGTGLQVGSPIAWISISDRSNDARTEKVGVPSHHAGRLYTV